MKNFKKFISVFTLLIVFIFGALGCGNSTESSKKSTDEKEVVKIGVGYQTAAAEGWGALIIKNKKLFEKYLKEKYPNKDFQIEWFNSPSGPPLTNNMVAGKLQLSFMGDMPTLINGEKGQTDRNYKSVFLAFDGKGTDGANQAILIPNQSNVKNIQDLNGKTVSTAVGSSAHHMLLKVLDKYGLKDKVTIVNQDPNVGMSNIEQNKIDANATWEPYPSLMESKNIGKVLVDGSDTKEDYLVGVVADRTWVEKNPDYAVAFLKALEEAHKYIRENPNDAAKIFQQETSYSIDVTTKVTKNTRFDSVIYKKDITTLSGSRDFLKKLDKLKDVDLNKFMDDKYLKNAYKELKLTYPTDSELNGNWLPLK